MSGSDFATIGEILAAGRNKLSDGRRAWVERGVGQGLTVDRNSQALLRLALVPRVMRHVADIDTSTSFAGVPMDYPVFLAPVGALAEFDEGDAAMAGRVAAEVGAGMMTSTLTMSPWEEVAATNPGRQMFQLYVFGDRDWMADGPRTGSRKRGLRRSR